MLLLKNNIEHKIRKMIMESSSSTVVIYPFQTIRHGNEDKTLFKLEARNFYDLLIANKLRPPTGLLNWCLEFELSEMQNRTALTFAKNAVQIYRIECSSTRL